MFKKSLSIRNLYLVVVVETGSTFLVEEEDWLVFPTEVSLWHFYIKSPYLHNLLIRGNKFHYAVAFKK